jgi:hypothetical protein
LVLSIDLSLNLSFLSLDLDVDGTGIETHNVDGAEELGTGLKFILGESEVVLVHHCLLVDLFDWKLDIQNHVVRSLMDHFDTECVKGLCDGPGHHLVDN